MSLYELIISDPTIRTYLSHYWEADRYHAAKSILLYGIFTMSLHYEAPLPMERLEYTVRRAKTIFQVDDKVPGLRNHLNEMNTDINCAIQDFDTKVENRQTRRKHPSRPRSTKPKQAYGTYPEWWGAMSENKPPKAAHSSHRSQNEHTRKQRPAIYVQRDGREDSSPEDIQASMLSTYSPNEAMKVFYREELSRIDRKCSRSKR